MLTHFFDIDVLVIRQMLKHSPDKELRSIKSVKNAKSDASIDFDFQQILHISDWLSYVGRRADALALRADERRDKLRKAAGRCK